MTGTYWLLICMTPCQVGYRYTTAVCTSSRKKTRVLSPYRYTGTLSVHPLLICGMIMSILHICTPLVHNLSTFSSTGHLTKNEVRKIRNSDSPKNNKFGGHYTKFSVERTLLSSKKPSLGQNLRFLILCRCPVLLLYTTLCMKCLEFGEGTCNDDIKSHRDCCFRSSKPHSSIGKKDADDAATANTGSDIPGTTARHRSSWPNI